MNNQDNNLKYGNFGVVLRYYDRKNNKYIAVKYGKNDADINVIKYIDENKNKMCSNLLIKYILHDNCIIMENTVGTINEFHSILTYKMSKSN